MKVLFDNCTSPTLAAILDGYLQSQGRQALHLKDLPCGRHASDVAWISELSRSGEEWLVVTGDLRIQRLKAERFAFRQAGLRGIVLAPAYQKLTVLQQASFLLWRWPDIENLSRHVASPFLFELPANRASRLRPLPL